MTQSAEHDRYTVTDICSEGGEVGGEKSSDGVYICPNKKSHLSNAPFVSLAEKTTVLQMHRH